MVSDAPVNQNHLDDLVTWLLDGARSVATPNAVVQEMCARLQDAEIALARAAVFVSTLHPSVFGRAFIWRPGQEVGIFPVGYDIVDSGSYRDNPVAMVIETGEPLRRSLATAADRAEFSIFEDLGEDGATDYLAAPLVFSDHSVHVVSWASARAGGFSDDELEALERIRLPLARVAEIYAFKRTARVLLDTYLGHQTGERVLKGMIRRGDGERINAVIWFTDLRHSTDLADQLPHQEFLGLLNSYFEAMAGAVLDHGGEVLRFIGDAALAIFPVEAAPGEGVVSACRSAGNAALDALQRIEVLNAQRHEQSEPLLEVGIGLHLGDVTYGNVGAENRLEFTVIGAAANEAARIEGLCKTVHRPLLASTPVATHLEGEWDSMGRHALRGVGREIEVFSPARYRPEA